MTGRPKIVVLGADASEPPPGLEGVGEVADLAFASTRQALEEALPGAGVLFAWHADRELLPAAWPLAKDLKWIQTASAGVDWLLFSDLVESHVVVTNARGVFDQAMAEYVLGLVLAMAKGLPATLEHQRRKEWAHRDAETLDGQRLLMAGVGPIGRAIGRTVTLMGMEVRGVGRTSRTGDDVFETIYGADELAEAVTWADWIVNALPLTKDTRHLFDDVVFAAMPAHARFVNVGRGATVDEPALVAALRDGRLAGAALDVFEEEPLPKDSPLWELPNVIVSPHMSGNFAGWREGSVEVFLENLVRYVSGRPLTNVVNKRRGYPTGE
ncbi:MAG TPA: D-2-hydroxyacid dehydrogenase [Actinomycetota bacterium]